MNISPQSALLLFFVRIERRWRSSFAALLRCESELVFVRAGARWPSLGKAGRAKRCSSISLGFLFTVFCLVSKRKVFLARWDTRRPPASSIAKGFRLGHFCVEQRKMWCLAWVVVFGSCNATLFTSTRRHFHNKCWSLNVWKADVNGMTLWSIF